MQLYNRYLILECNILTTIEIWIYMNWDSSSSNVGWAWRALWRSDSLIQQDFIWSRSSSSWSCFMLRTREWFESSRRNTARLLSSSTSGSEPGSGSTLVRMQSKWLNSSNNNRLVMIKIKCIIVHCAIWISLFFELN